MQEAPVLAHQEGGKGPVLVVARVVQPQHAAVAAHAEHQPLRLSAIAGVLRVSILKLNTLCCLPGRVLGAGACTPLSMDRSSWCMQACMHKGDVGMHAVLCQDMKGLLLGAQGPHLLVKCNA